jgi:alginate O-acetyltransferase complex protein AlgI
MLFNSYPFLLGFFPAVLLIFFLPGRGRQALAAVWLALASLFFYGYWSLSALPLLLISICANYGFGLWVNPALGADPAADQRRRKRRLTLAVVLNLAVLGYFKYANFFIDAMNGALHVVSGAQLQLLNVVLPIGISFFTFTQIAFLVDCYEGKVRERNFAHYVLFVSYFPHLISGPVLHHSQMMPQFRLPQTYTPAVSNMVTGLLSVTAGLAKKTLLADEFSQYASPIFEAAGAGHDIGRVAAWTGALAYTLQIYFDFSGYSDMAVGLSRMLGISLPLNFDAPYKSVSIIEFWRRWHMSLSQFLRDYLYVRLGGNRYGTVRRYINLMLTMLLGGLWHGASWTFVAWGGLHGTYLLVNHAWRSATKSMPTPGAALALVGRLAGLLVTFLAVVIGWVFFRATTFAGAQRMLIGMFAPTPDNPPLQFDLVYRGMLIPPTSFTYLGLFFVVGFLIVWLLPTTQVVAQRFANVSGPRAWFYIGVLLFCIALLAMINASHNDSEFIYFNF